MSGGAEYPDEARMLFKAKCKMQNAKCKVLAAAGWPLHFAICILHFAFCIKLRLVLQPAYASSTAARRRSLARGGAASLDYILVLGVIFPLAAFIMWIAPRIIRLAYEMAVVLISSPFL
jgi:hypothetical protein